MTFVIDIFASSKIFVATISGGVCVKDRSNEGLKTLKTVAGLGIFFGGIIYSSMGLICLKRFTEGVKPRSRPLASDDSLDDSSGGGGGSRKQAKSSSYGSTKNSKIQKGAGGAASSSTSSLKYQADAAGSQSSPSPSPKQSKPPPSSHDDNPFSQSNYKEEKGGLWS